MTKSLSLPLHAGAGSARRRCAIGQRSGRGRRGTVLALVLVVASCRSGPDAGVVARVGDWVLSREQLADLLVLAQPLPLDSATVDALVEQWIATAGLAQRAAAGTDLNSPEALDASLWLERREALLEADRRMRLGEATRVSPAQARTEFEADTLFLLAHVLRRTDASTSDAERELQRRTAQRILDGLVEGGSWAEAVKQSEDAATRDASGLLALMTVDELHVELRRAAVTLEPGQVSSVVESPHGYHILFRPRFEEVAALYAARLSGRLLEQEDAAARSRMRDSLGVRVSAAAPGAVRDLAGGVDPDRESSPLAVWDGGALHPGVAARYVAALPDDDRNRLASGTDESAIRFVEQLAVREARLDVARRSGVQADAETLAGLIEMHRADVEGRMKDLSEGGVPLSRPTLDRYMQRLAARQTPLRPIAPLFHQWLLEPFEWTHDRVAQNDAVAVARRLLEAAERTGS